MKPSELPQILAKNPRVPTLSPVAAKLVGLAADERTSAGQLGDIIGTDAGLSAKILKIANSSFYSNSTETTRISDAVRVLGLRAVRNAVLGVSVFELMGTRSKGPSFALTMWERSLHIAVLSRTIAQGTDLDPEEAFVLGLLSDVGVLAMIHLFPNEYAQCAPLPGLQIEEVLERERKVFGIDHQEAGRIMAERWNLPRQFREAIATHHSPVEEGVEEITLASIQKISASIIHSLHDGRRIEGLNQARSVAQDRLGISRKKLDEMLAILPENVAEIVSQFDLDIDAPLSYVEALLNANQRLADMNLKYEEMTRQLEDANLRLTAMARVDGLTGLANRRAFDDALKRECARASRYGGKLILAIGDIDLFKTCNDQRGHLVGDDVLRAVGTILSASVRASDLASRYGGEEFTILLPEIDLESARGVLERLREEISSHEFQSDRGPFNVTISFGAASMNPTVDLSDPSSLIQRADAMLYKAKQNGRNRVHFEGDTGSQKTPASLPLAA
jgi:diguanylate cyclase (GGDEF)-like protein